MKKIFTLDRTVPIEITDLFDGADIETLKENINALCLSFDFDIQNDKKVEFRTQSYGYNGEIEVLAKIMREETDYEYEQRMSIERMAKETKDRKKKDKEAAELKEYKRLQKKFEKRLA